MVENGTVKFYNVLKGFGFITNVRDGKDIFVHSTSLSGVQKLAEGQKVQFETREGKKGLEAFNVVSE